MRISAAYAPRHFAMGQENVLMAISGILNQVPQVSKRFILEVLQHNPEIVDLLFQCAIEPRNPWYPETEVDSIACEALVNLFSFPLGRIPGVLVNMDEGEIKEEDKAEVHAALDALRLLVSRPHWASKILAVWKKLDEEKWPKVKRCVSILSVHLFLHSPGYLIMSLETIRHNTHRTLNHSVPSLNTEVYTIRSFCI